MKFIKNILSKLHLFFVGCKFKTTDELTREELKEDVYFWRSWEKFEWKLHFRVAEKFSETIHSDKWKKLSEEEKLKELKYIIYTFPFERRKEFRKKLEEEENQ